MEPSNRSIDKAAQEMIGRMARLGQQNAWDRLDAQLPQCGFGKQGICCRICSMGPCRISKKASAGVCGADVDTIVARNFLRMIAAGVSAHSDHGRTVAEVFLAAVRWACSRLPAQGHDQAAQAGWGAGCGDRRPVASGHCRGRGRDCPGRIWQAGGGAVDDAACTKPRQELWQKLGVTPSRWTVR